MLVRLHQKQQHCIKRKETVICLIMLVFVTIDASVALKTCEVVVSHDYYSIWVYARKTSPLVELYSHLMAGNCVPQ